MKTRTTRKADTSVAREPRSPAYANAAVQRVNARFDSATASKLGEVTVGEGISVTEALKRAVVLLHAKFRADHLHKSRRPILVKVFDLNYVDCARAASLVLKYRDLPMDFADASLVILAEHLGHGRILSSDRRDFEAFRFKNSHSFENLLFQS